MVPALALIVPVMVTLPPASHLIFWLARYPEPSAANEIFPHPNVAEPSVFRPQ